MSPRAAAAKMFLGMIDSHHDCVAGWAFAAASADSGSVGSEATAPAGRLTALNPARVASAAKTAAIVSASRKSRSARAPIEPAEFPVAPAVAASVSASANGSAIIWSAEIQSSPIAFAVVPRSASEGDDEPWPATPSANPPTNARRDQVVNERKGRRDRPGAADSPCRLLLS